MVPIVEWNSSLYDHWHPPLAHGYQVWYAHRFFDNIIIQGEIHTFHNDDETTGQLMCGSCENVKFRIWIMPGEYSVVAQCWVCGHKAEIYSG